MAAPIGNKYAVGNRGGGAPLGNRNAWKHGGYARITLEELTEEERDLLPLISTDVRTLIKEELALLSIRERRLMQRVNRLQELEMFENATITREELQEFDRRTLPGHPYRLTTISKATHDMAMRYGETLTRCQREKLRCVKLLVEVEGQHEDPHENYLAGFIMEVYKRDRSGDRHTCIGDGGEGDAGKA